MRKILIAFLLLFLFLCEGCTDNNKVTNSKPTLSNEEEINSQLVQDKELLIGGKAILHQKYEDVLKTWGDPKEIKKVIVHFPATVEKYYCYILKYDSIDIEMYPVIKNVPVENTESFRFDITGVKYDFYGVKVGMTLEEYLNRVKNKDVYSVKEILSASVTDDMPYEKLLTRKLLRDLKVDNYYLNYDKAKYQSTLNGVPQGAVMLFKDDILERIVFGYPTAG